MSVRTRFAPSPTGFLHIGGARTALFNYVFARAHGGQYLLRIEDTDKARSTTEAIEAIHNGLSWLGLDGDEPVIMQSDRSERHKEVAQILLDSGHAYKCYLSDAELSALREEAHKTGQAIRSPWRDKSGDEAPHNASFVVRLKMPDDGTITINDLVQGQVQITARQLDDMVILRSDGTPVYMLAVVVDDHDMDITHIIRGDDHLNNAFRQLMVYEALGWQAPAFAHIPLIHGADGAKLSKRHGALGVDSYQDDGYLSQAICNYLMRLGWSYGDEEYFTLAQAIEWFDIAKVGKAPARFDTEKLRSVNQFHLRQADPNDLADKILQHYEADRLSPNAKSRLTSLMPLLTDRAQTLNELSSGQEYLVYDGAVSMQEDAAALLSEEASALLLKFADYLPEQISSLDHLKEILNAFLDGQGLKMKHIGLPLRAVLTGTKSSPSITDIIVALGHEEVVNRIKSSC
ncbi:MAG: glutamate--tRNA ligase [Candidatus Puniceispirillaceae bacterium]